MDVNIIVTLIVAVLTCLFGYKLNKAVIALCGFIIGYNLCNTVLTPLISSDIAVIILSSVVGLIIGLIAFKLYLVGIFLACFFLVYSVCNVYIDAEPIKQIAGAIGGVIVGLLGVKFTRPIMIISTSFSGAFIITDTVFELISYNVPVISLIAGLIIGVLSAGYQFRSTSEEEE